MLHRTENCVVKCSFCAGLGHSEDKCWKKPRDGRTHPGSANFLEVMLMLQNKAADFMKEEVTDDDNYDDWIQWAVDAEQT
jgi:hypothetical protein